MQMTEDFARKVFFREGFSRKGAKRCRVPKGFLCAFAGEIFSVEHTSLFAPAALRCDLVVTGWRAGKSQLTGE
jgi:hypothetical protein